MKTCAVILLLGLGFCASAWAHPPRLYVGGSVQGNVVGEEERLRPDDDTPPAFPNYMGIGMQIEGGVAVNICHAYLGFRQDLSGLRRGTDYRENNSWHAERFLLGARLHVSDEYPNPVKPLLGAGLTYGWAQRRLETQHGMWAGELTEESSKGSLGWLAEAGFLVDLHDRLYLSFMLRFETLNAQFGDQTRYGSIKNVRQAAVQLGVVYQLERRL